MTRTRVQHGLLAVLALVLTLSCSDETSPSRTQRAIAGEGGAGGAGGEGGAGGGSGMDAGYEPPTEVVVADEDTFVSGWPGHNQNHSTETLLSLQGSPQGMRPLIKFDLEDIRDAVAGRESCPWVSFVGNRWVARPTTAHDTTT